MKKLIIVLVLHYFLKGILVAQVPVPYIHVKTSNTNSSYRLNSIVKIEWESRLIDNVNIYVCPSGLATFDEASYKSFTSSHLWTLIAKNIPANQKSYQWNMQSPFSRYLFKIEDCKDSTIYDLSDNSFSTFNNDEGLKILYPKGLETFKALDFYSKIIFRKTGDPQIKIQLSVNGKRSWQTTNLSYRGYDYINYSPMSYCPISFEIPNVISDSCFIRIVDSRTDSILDETERPFKIRTNTNKFIKFTSQKGFSNICYYGRKCLISWDFNNLNSISIQYTLDDLKAASLSTLNDEIKWKTLASNIPASDCKYYITSNDSLNGALFKISDSQDENVYDITECPLTISDIGRIKIHYPQGGEIFDLTQNYNKLFIKSLSMMSPVIYEISYDSLRTWNEIKSLSYIGMDWPFVYGHFSPIVWATPNSNSSNCFIRVRDMSDISIIFDTTKKINITNNANKRIKILTQKGNFSENCIIDSLLIIKWLSKGITKIKIEKSLISTLVSKPSELYTPFNWVLIANNVNASDSSFKFITKGDLYGYRFKITDMYDTLVYDITESPITPVSKMDVEILYPNGGEILIADSSFYNILWKTLNRSNQFAKIEISTDVGNTWSPIKTMQQNAEVQKFMIAFSPINWKIPQTNSDKCKLRIVDASTNEVLFTMKNTFSIVYKQSTFLDDGKVKEGKKNTIYPNPSKGILYLNNSNEIKLFRIFDSIGRQLFESRNPSNVISLNLKSGIYFVSILYINNTIESSKLVIQK